MKPELLYELPEQEGVSPSKREWRCKCGYCGDEFDARFAHLKSGATRSCSCQRAIGVTTHGLSYHPHYHVWRNMIRRCDDRDDPNYGGRGIKVCDRWRESFQNFLDDMGERPEGQTLERDDPDGDYCQGNCRWATRREQARNKRNNVVKEFRGVALCLAEWAEWADLPYNLVYDRVYHGWTIERSLLTGAKMPDTLDPPPVLT